MKLGCGVTASALSMARSTSAADVVRPVSIAARMAVMSVGAASADGVVVMLAPSKTEVGWPARSRHKAAGRARSGRSEEHTSELQSLMRISYAVFCLKKTNNCTATNTHTLNQH